MLYATYVPEPELEAMVRRQVDDIKEQYPEWNDPTKLCHKLRLTLHVGQLGDDREGAALGDTVIVNPASRRARRLFTTYHEIVHVLIRGNDNLYSALHDQYPNERDFERIIERLCNVGAAEFLIPRDAVRQAIERSGFSLSLLPELMGVSMASPTAICVALALYAQHRCIAVVCRMAPIKELSAPHLFAEAAAVGMVLQVETAVSSRAMTYVIARGSTIHQDHLFYVTAQSNEGQVLQARAPIPFRFKYNWIAECEALRIGNQVFGLCHADPPPVHISNQLRLL